MVLKIKFFQESWFFGSYTQFLHIIVILTLLCQSVSAQTENAYSEMEPSLVKLKFTGLLRSTNVKKSSHATGVIVSDDGLVITVHHALAELGDVKASSVKVLGEITHENGNKQELEGVIIDALINTDLMLLKLEGKRGGYKQAQLGDLKSHDRAKPLLTSGYPAKGDPAYREREMKMTAPRTKGYRMPVNVKFLEGESGSPVYNKEGEVLAVVKGDLESSGQIIPMRYADSLLAQVKLRSIIISMKDFDVLRKKMRWTAERVNYQISIMYEKEVSGYPHVEDVLVKIKPILICVDDKEERGREITVTLGEEDRLEIQENLKATYLLEPKYWQEVKIRSSQRLCDVKSATIAISPTLTDGSPGKKAEVLIQPLD